MSQRNETSWIATAGLSCSVDGSHVAIISEAFVTPLRRVYLSFGCEVVGDGIASPCSNATSQHVGYLMIVFVNSEVDVVLD